MLEKIAIENKMRVVDVQEEYHKYWKAVKGELQKTSECRIIIPFFGSFQIVPKKLKRGIKQMNKKIEVLDTKESYTRVVNIKSDYIKKLKQLCHLYKITLQEDTEVCQICSKL